MPEKSDTDPAGNCGVQGTPPNIADAIDCLADGWHMSLPMYRELIERLQNEGYTSSNFASARRDRRHLILRHDVDMCLDRAVRLAHLEAEMGVNASYFVLLDTEMYNTNSRAGHQALRKIVDLGHDVGLHFDPSHLQPGDFEELQSACRRQCEILETCLRRSVDVVTFHRPAEWLLGYPDLVAGRVHGYQPRFFNDMGYCSDSEGRFRFHHPLHHPAVREGRALQLVTHPIWWCAEIGEGPLDKLDRFLDGRRRALANELASNCKPYAASRVA